MATYFLLPVGVFASSLWWAWWKIIQTELKSCSIKQMHLTLYVTAFCRVILWRTNSTGDYMTQLSTVFTSAVMCKCFVIWQEA